MAQFGGGFPGGGGMRGGRGGGGDRSAAREQQRPATAGSRVDMLEQTIEELRVLLKLLSAQMPAWESYTGKVRALAGDIGRSRSQMPAGP
jgi:nicotinamide mononucleotide adenylyltransferase